MATLNDILAAIQNGVQALNNLDLAIKSNGSPSASLIRAQRSVTNAGSSPLVASDSILNINSATDLMQVILASTSRAGAPLTFKNIPGSHLQTLQAHSTTDLIDGSTNYLLASGASLTIVPYNDGVNKGWAVE